MNVSEAYSASIFEVKDGDCGFLQNNQNNIIDNTSLHLN
jgi:hypothetical protein